MAELRQFLIDVLDRRNLIINKISKDVNNKEQFQKIVNDLRLTEQSFKPTLKTVVALLLSNSKTNGRLASLLIFGIELDSFHSLNSSWYRRDMLIETLYNVLLGSKLSKQEEEYSFWEYTFILFICSFFLILLKKI